MSTAVRDSGPSEVALVVPEGVASRLADAVRVEAASRRVPLEVRAVPWTEDPAVRRAKADGSRAAAWLRAHEPPLTDEQRAVLADADVIVCFGLPAGIAEVAPRARFVQATSAGVGPVVGVLRGSSLRLASAAGLSGEKVAEFAMARMLTVWSDARKLDALQRARRWGREEIDTASIAGRTVLVVGTGGIGQALARRATAFGLRCIGVRRRPELGAPPSFERVVGTAGLKGELPDADAVVLALPATERTGRLFGEEELSAMKRGSLLCNVARGTLVDEDALVAALESGHLGAAVLDVTAVEPLSRRSALWRAPNVYLSPHVANDWNAEYLDAIARLVVENVARERRGDPLLNLVDLTEGY